MNFLEWLLETTVDTIQRLWRVFVFGFTIGMVLSGSFLFSLITGGVWLLLISFAVVNLYLFAWPLLVAIVACYWLASLRGWPPARMWRVAAGALPMFVTFVGLTGWLWYTSPSTEHSETWVAVALAPLNAFVRAHEAIAEGRYLHAAVVELAPVVIPIGLIVAGVIYRSRVLMMEAGLVGWSSALPTLYDHRQWARSARTARQRVRAPGGVPLLTRRGNPVLGATIRSLYRGARPIVEVGYRQLRSHMLIVGTTGAGKSTAMVRLWVGFWAAASRWHAKRREYRPWLVVIDAKGGFDGRDTADRALRALQDVGAGQRGRVAIWPDQVSLNLWQLSPARLVEVLVDLVPVAKEGAAAFYADVLAAVVDLAVHAPGGPPVDRADFLRRLDPAWLNVAYAGDTDHQYELTAARKHVGDIALRYRTLLNRLGPGFDGNAGASKQGGRNGDGFDQVTDFDVLYCIIEGTASTTVAEAQARALVELISDAAARWGRDDPSQPGERGEALERRAGLIALDEFSSVAGRLRIYERTERWRSLGLAVQLGAQSWESLGPTQDERLRLAGTAAGGVLVMRSPNPEDLCRLAGTRKVFETSHKIIDGGFGDEGSARLQDTFVVDPNKVRHFGTGQAALIEGNSATYLQVAAYRPTPLALTSTRIDTGPEPSSEAGPKREAPTQPPAELVLPPTHRPEHLDPAPEQPRPIEPLDDLDDVFGEDRRR